MRVLALDYGRKRIGTALSDPLRIIAQPRGYLENNSKFLASLKALVEENEVSEIVIGLPHSMSGNPSEMTHEVEKFGALIRNTLSQPVHFFDERLTTSAAEKLLVESNVRRDKRKEVRDQIAAALILQAYLQSTQGAGK
jgi:putative holliday junction resolvase